MSDWESYLEKNQAGYIDQLKEFCSIPSVSSLSEHIPDVIRAAEWVAARLTQAGIENVQVLPTGGHPVVYGEWLHAGDKPTVLVYGHLDTQPVDPLELWDSPPFEPRIEDGKIYARGASDNKGNMFAALLGVEALLKANGELPLNVKFLFEGQEEIGSPQIPDFLAKHKELFACDIVLNADGGQYSEDQPLITTGLRGICGLQINMTGPCADLHSGGDGGAIANPVNGLARLVASMHLPDGTIAVEGFYDDVRVYSDEERAKINEVPFDEAEYLGRVGSPGLFGEPGYTTHERHWIRPTLDANGIWGGFQGEGTKTIVPSKAGVKITCRLVPDQDPGRILELLKAHIEANTPEGVTVEITPLAIQASPYLIPFDHPANQAAAEVLREMYGKEPYITRNGGSVPITGFLLEQLGALSVNLAFGLDDENIHAPNEYFRLESFAKCQKATGRMMFKLAEIEEF